MRDFILASQKSNEVLLSHFTDKETKFQSSATHLSDLKASHEIVLQIRWPCVYEAIVTSQYTAAVGFINHCAALLLAVFNNPVF